MSAWPADCVLASVIACYKVNPADVLPFVKKLEHPISVFGFKDFELAMALNELIGSLCRCPPHEREQYAQELADKFLNDTDNCLSRDEEEVISPESSANAHDIPVEQVQDPPSHEQECEEVVLQVQHAEQVEEHVPGEFPDELTTPTTATAVEVLLAAEDVRMTPDVIVPEYVEPLYNEKNLARVTDPCIQAYAIRDFAQFRSLGYSRRVVRAAYERARKHNNNLPPLPTNRRASDHELRRHCNRAMYRIRFRPTATYVPTNHEWYFYDRHATTRVVDCLVHGGRPPATFNRDAFLYLTTLYPPINYGNGCEPSAEFKRFQRMLH